MPVAFIKSNATGIFVRMSTSKHDTASQRTKPKRKGSGPVAFFVSLFILALGAIQLVSTFHSYALNLAELNGLKRQEAALIERKQELENDIARWDDTAYVTAQARERLGFVFPGEQAIRVDHPEAVTGESDTKQQTGDSSSEHSSLPWYSELSYALKQADQSEDTSTSPSTTDNSSGSSGSADGTDGSAGQSGNSQQ